MRNKDPFYSIRPELFKSYLEEARSKKQEHIYFIGVDQDFNITISMQQVRALNLVTALIRQKKITRTSQVGIVGGGPAGIMAATAIASKLSCKVTLIEQEDEVASLFRGSYYRFVSPTIFRHLEFYNSDWGDTKFPFFNWDECYGDELHRVFNEKWSFYKKRLGIKENLGTKIKSIRVLSGTHPIQLITTKNKKSRFDVVIVANGFGKKYIGYSYPSCFKNFWTSGAPHDYDAACSGGKKKIFISGTGDSGLLELFNFCFWGFRHHQIKKYLPRLHQRDLGPLVAMETSVMNDIKAWEIEPEHITSNIIQMMSRNQHETECTEELRLVRKITKMYRDSGGFRNQIPNHKQIKKCMPLVEEWLYLTSYRQLRESYEAVPVAEIDKEYWANIEHFCRKNVKIYLNSSGKNPYSVYASSINQFLLSILLRKGLVKHIPGRVKFNGRRVTFLDSGKIKEFDVLIQRHGSKQKKMFKSFFPNRQDESLLGIQMHTDTMLQFYHCDRFFKKTKLRRDFARISINLL